jgi:acyl dehydratase
VDFCHQHNLVDPAVAGRERKFGIRVSLPAEDTLRNVVGDDWEQLHWYPTAAERDSAFAKMAIRHGYYRDTDSPTQTLEKVSR